MCLCLPLCPFVPMGISSSLGCHVGNTAISNQLVAGSMIVTHIKSISVLSLPLRVYGPMRSTHKGVVMASFAGSFPYLWCLRLFTWQLWHFLTCDWTVCLRPFQYIKDKEFPWDMCSWGVEGSGDIMLLHVVVGLLELPFCLFTEYFYILN